MDYGGHYPQRVGDWLVVNDRLKYRFDDVHNPIKEHIHVKLNKKEYSWYRQGHAIRHSNTYGLDSLTNTAEKLLKKNGVPNDYFNSISILPRVLRDYYSIYNINMPDYNLEIFPFSSNGFNLETIPEYIDNSYLEVFGAPPLNLPNVNPFPMTEQGVQVLVVVGLVIVGIAAILLAPYTGGASLALI